jgi:hypothetical protein
MSELDVNRHAGDARTTESPIPTPSELKDVIEAERAGLPFVHWRSGGDHRLLVLRSERQRLTVGRRPDADVALVGDPEVSRAHAARGHRRAVERRRRRPLP